LRDRWFVVLDSHKARLLRGARTAKGSPHLEEFAALGSTFAHGEHHRPDRLGTPGRSAGVGHEHEEQLAHFAREVVPWLQKEFSEHAIATCALFAPAHTMGALRKELGKPLASRLVEYEVELAGLPLAQLGSHPRILAVLDS
jgi:protein required for attachment to host cells